LVVVFIAFLGPFWLVLEFSKQYSFCKKKTQFPHQLTLLFIQPFPQPIVCKYLVCSILFSPIEYNFKEGGLNPIQAVAEKKEAGHKATIGSLVKARPIVETRHAPR
jgi:hypothetical protein